MNPNQKPHSRDKKVESGKASVNKGRRVNTGRVGGTSSRPTGNTNRPSGGGIHPLGTSGNHSSQNPITPIGNQTTGGNGGMPMRASGGLSLKKILGIAVVILIAYFILKSCGGIDLGSGITDMGGSDIGGLIDWGNGSGNSSGNGSNYNGYTDYSGNLPLNYEVSPLARDKRVTPLGNGNDTVTVMVYMCGTDLESKYGMATKDLVEMTSAKLSDKVNVIVETGGCKQWQNDTISSRKNQIYQVKSGGLVSLKDDAGSAAMTDPKNLTSFINYCETNFPANRNILIFWDHGGGTVTGYGYDEKNPNASSMTLNLIGEALKNADCTFDFIGFDACLMATFETALVCDGYADYLLASEETEPGTGWYYTNWLTALSKDPGASTLDIAKIIIDDFISTSTSSSSGAKVTLSLIDLAELEGAVPEAFNNFSTSTNELIRSDSEGYAQVSDARAGVRQFSQSSKINQVDLVDLALRIGTEESKELAEVLRGCVKYNRSSISRCNGISIYFPYENTHTVKSAVASFKELGIDNEYTKCIQSFASLEFGGQTAANATQIPSGSTGSSADLLGSILTSLGGGSSSTSPLDVLTGSFLSGGSSSAGMSVDPTQLISLLGAFSGRSMPTSLSWVDTDLIADNAANIADTALDPSRITVSYQGQTPVLSLTAEEWAQVQTVELNVFVDDGEGYIDLGLDNTFEFDGNNLLLEYDGTWLTVNGNTCAYYLVSDTEMDDGSYVTIGRIPAYLNDTYVNLQVVFDAENPYGTITGAYPAYPDGETELEAKGCIDIVPGDRIELLCDYYTYDGDYSASYTLGDAFIVPLSGLSLSNRELDAENFSVTYRLTDRFDNHYWTPAL